MAAVYFAPPASNPAERPSLILRILNLERAPGSIGGLQPMNPRYQSHKARKFRIQSAYDSGPTVLDSCGQKPGAAPRQRTIHEEEAANNKAHWSVSDGKPKLFTRCMFAAAPPFYVHFSDRFFLAPSWCFSLHNKGKSKCTAMNTVTTPQPQHPIATYMPTVHRQKVAATNSSAAQYDLSS
jgi:hypothetical protein